MLENILYLMEEQEKNMTTNVDVCHGFCYLKFKAEPYGLCVLIYEFICVQNKSFYGEMMEKRNNLNGVAF